MKVFNPQAVGIRHYERTLLTKYFRFYLIFFDKSYFVFFARIRYNDFFLNFIFNNDPHYHLKKYFKTEKKAIDQNSYIPFLRNKFSKIFEESFYRDDLYL